MEPDSVVDVAGVCRKVGELNQFTGETSGHEFKKRYVTLVDSSGFSVDLTVWGHYAEAFDGTVNPIAFIKRARINEFGDAKSISINNGSTMQLNADISEAHELREWYDSHGHKEDLPSVSVINTATASSIDWVNNFFEAKERNLVNVQKPDYYQCKAFIQFVKMNNCVYKSCNEPNCCKKVVHQSDNIFKCEKCGVLSSQYKYKLRLTASIADWSTNRWVTVFSDQAEKLLGYSCDEVGRAFENNKEEFERIVSKSVFKGYIFHIRAMVKNVTDTSRNKLHVMNISPINHKEYNAHLAWVNLAHRTN